ncbi:MAG TPA: transporter [Gammaproteobacteria bacterium]|nr:transporter [Gammaproteobacteria bacterium]
MLSQVFEIVAPLLIIASVGYVYGVRVKPEMQFTNRLVMDVFMPALILQVMLTEGFNVADYSGLIFAGVLLMLVSGMVAYAFSKVMGFDWRAVTPAGMFSNWANLGLPLYVFALGSEALNGGVMLVVAGNILCFTIGVAIYSGTIKVLDVLKTPIVIAVIVGLSVSSSGLNIPTFVTTPIGMLGQAVIPLMLFSLGVRLTKVSLNDSAIGIAVGLFCPIVGVGLALLLCLVIDLSEIHRATLILFGVLPPAVVNFMLAEQYNRNPDQVASIVMIGNLIGLITIPLVLVGLIL